jgi:spore coat polysaccharide biosynthesis protein SpsF (cytidylyltransferase family)
MMFTAFIQARMGSKRLPEKVLLKLDAKNTVLDKVYSQVALSNSVKRIVILTSTNEKDNQLSDYCVSKGYEVFRGDENNVLKRFINAADFFKEDVIFRICADNPFISTNLINKLAENYHKQDYLSFKVGSNPAIKTHFGIFTELVSLSSLKKIDSILSVNSQHREHVTSGIYTNTNEFKVEFLKYTVLKEKELRLTLDDIEDFDIIKNILRLISYDVGFEYVRLINDIPLHLKNRMKRQIEKYEK